MTRLVTCVDFGSTFTKALLVDLDTAEVITTANSPTTIATDVMDGWNACRAVLAHAAPAAVDAEVLACSSAGGGLRLAVIGNEELVTAGGRAPGCAVQRRHRGPRGRRRAGR
jgi:sugar (pentulose or hexulose) kinase